MGGIAQLARESGHRVSGSDRGVYPPMSTQLERLGIVLHEGYEAEALSGAGAIDVVVVGNVMSRGVGAIEYMLDQRMRYTSGPEWLARHVLADRHVLAVAGTHGKTTTASMLAWILERAGLDPGFLIGGVPVDFGISARLGGSEYFVVEADEYDTAFFDKRSKFVHYRPSTLVVTNIEYDHADIFPDLDAICRQFHHLVRTVPGNGRILAHRGSQVIDEVLARGCWTPVQRYDETAADWVVAEPRPGEIAVSHAGRTASGPFSWPGRHYRLNALAACAAAAAVGVDPDTAVAALGCWRGVRRRLEHVGEAGGVTIYDDFAHHPTEIAATLEAMRAVAGTARLVAAFEPRSNSMKMGTHREALGASFAQADSVYVYRPAELHWNIHDALRNIRGGAVIESDYAVLLEHIEAAVRPGDHVVFMSNGAFGALARQLLRALQTSSG